jgi:DNA-binding transcriptional MerR regulator
MTREVGYTIRAMAARCRMTAYTLRYYERVGLIQAIERARNGHRRYSDADEAWLRFLQFLRATRMPIREIRRYAALRQNGANDASEQRKVLEEHRRSLDDQITKLKEAVALLTTHIEILHAKQPAVSLPSPRLPEWEEQEQFPRRGKLPDFEASRGQGFTSSSEPEL